MFLTVKLYTCKTEMFEIEQIIYNKMDLALNNLQRLLCHKTQPTNQPTNQHLTPIVYFQVIDYNL